MSKLELKNQNICSVLSLGRGQKLQNMVYLTEKKKKKRIKTERGAAFILGFTRESECRPKQEGFSRPAVACQREDKHRDRKDKM